MRCVRRIGRRGLSGACIEGMLASQAKYVAVMDADLQHPPELVPLLLAGVVTLEICVLITMPLNFANIIALPLLLGIGVAFKIYFVLAWRSGRTKLRRGQTI